MCLYISIIIKAELGYITFPTLTEIHCSSESDFIYVFACM